MSAAAAAVQRLDFEQVRRILPQQFPLIMVDRVIELEPQSRILALKNVTGNEPHFVGHFPEHAVMPGVLIIEAAAQAVILMCAAGMDLHDRQPRHYLANANISFRSAVTPGDQMVIEAKAHRRMGTLLIAKIKVTVGTTVAADGELTVAEKPRASG
jgi:3-hydroxyacyl-[acyl-carrier-protein] dehydratase